MIRFRRISAAKSEVLLPQYCFVSSNKEYGIYFSDLNGDYAMSRWLHGTVRGLDELPSKDDQCYFISPLSSLIYVNVDFIVPKHLVHIFSFFNEKCEPVYSTLPTLVDIRNAPRVGSKVVPLLPDNYDEHLEFWPKPRKLDFGEIYEVKAINLCQFYKMPNQIPFGGDSLESLKLGWNFLNENKLNLPLIRYGYGYFIRQDLFDLIGSLMLDSHFAKFRSVKEVPKCPVRLEY